MNFGLKESIGRRENQQMPFQIARAVVYNTKDIIREPARYH